MNEEQYSKEEEINIIDKFAAILIGTKEITPKPIQ